MIDPLICECGARYFPRPDGLQKCRTCKARDAAIAVKVVDEFDDNDEREPPYLPTQEEIEQAKEEIRREWTTAQWRAAASGKRD